MNKLLIVFGFATLNACTVVAHDAGDGGAGGACDSSEDSSTADQASSSTGQIDGWVESCTISLCAAGACAPVQLTGYPCGVSGNCFHGACLEPI